MYHCDLCSTVPVLMGHTQSWASTARPRSILQGLSHTQKRQQGAGLVLVFTLFVKSGPAWLTNSKVMRRLGSSGGSRPAGAPTAGFLGKLQVDS